MTNKPAPTAPPAPVSLGKAFWYWLKLGFVSFGGPTGQIAMMHQELIERRRWISERRFLHALNYCMVLPGPEAIQLATYIGWLMHKTCGGIIGYIGGRIAPGQVRNQRRTRRGRHLPRSPRSTSATCIIASSARFTDKLSE